MRIIYLGLAIGLLVSCGKEEMKPDFSCGEEISLEMDIMPIINANCAISQCHLDTKNPIFSSSQVVIDNAETIRLEVSGGFMPPPSASPLELDEIQMIKCWVDDGARNN